MQLRDPWFPQKLLKLLLSSDFPAARLDVEISESCLHENLTAVQTMIVSLKNIGVRVSLDDFGTGYSSMSYIQEFPFDRIKLDRSFTSALGKDRQSNAFVRAMLALGSSLDISVLAEGVETASQMDFLTAEGCSEVQGFMFSRPSLLVHGQSASRKHGTS